MSIDSCPILRDGVWLCGCVSHEAESGWAPSGFYHFRLHVCSIVCSIVCFISNSFISLTGSTFPIVVSVRVLGKLGGEKLIKLSSIECFWKFFFLFFLYDICTCPGFPSYTNMSSWVIKFLELYSYFCQSNE